MTLSSAPFELTPPPDDGPGLDAVDSEQFIRWIADRYRADAGGTEDCDELARATYEALLDSERCEFGDPGFDWTSDGAAQLADDDMEEWDGDWES